MAYWLKRIHRFYKTPRFLTQWFIYNWIENIRKGTFLYLDHSRYIILDLIRKFREKQPLWARSLTATEMFYLAILIKSVNKLNGNIAEVGVYNGGSAKIIGKFKDKSKILYLFDTFDGLPEVSKIDKRFYEGQFNGSLETTQEYLSDCQNIKIHPGLFPHETGFFVKDKTFVFVHLDVDIYRSTYDCLDFFYPRLVLGGIILTHDYPKAHGVKKAFNEFFRNKREPIIEISGSQAFIIKTGGIR